MDLLGSFSRLSHFTASKTSSHFFHSHTRSRMKRRIQVFRKEPTSTTSLSHIIICSVVLLFPFAGTVSSFNTSSRSCSSSCRRLSWWTRATPTSSRTKSYSGIYNLKQDSPYLYSKLDPGSSRDICRLQLSKRCPLEEGSSSDPPTTPTDKVERNSLFTDSIGENRKNDITQIVTRMLSQRSALWFTLVMAFSGAALGPFLDSYHSLFGVLSYDQPLSFDLWGQLLSSQAQPALITSWWVPELFGVAGVLIGWLYILFDDIQWWWQQPLQHPHSSSLSASWPKIMLGISIFTFQYWLSGVLFQHQVDRTTILNVMSVIAGLEFGILDATISGFIVSTATALGGPLIEVGLLSLSRADLMWGSGYHYTDPGETGFFPLWIVPVYFAGGPAVGNLARGVWKTLRAGTKKLPGCTACNDSRCIPCPNCDGVGSYIAMGDRTVRCSSCRGRGFVICRSCFEDYGEDPYDIDAIREKMSRMPD